MLVLSRKSEQRIRIGDDIEITIVAISGDNVRIGIEAPKHIKILRSEVYEELCKENKAAMTSQEISGNVRDLIKMLSDSGKN